MKRTAGFLILGLLVASMGAMATTKQRNLQIVNSTIQLGASGTTLSGTVGNSGNVQEAGTIASGAGINVCTDANSNTTTTACSSISSYSVTTESSGTALTGSTLTTVITKAVTMPAAGCPCRVLANWTQYMTTSGSSAVADALVQDNAGPNNFAESEWAVSQNNGVSGTGSGMSPVTYANSASVTFTLKVQIDASGGTAQAAPFHAYGGRNSRLELSIIPSN
jgi:hypothetical protein